MTNQKAIHGVNSLICDSQNELPAFGMWKDRTDMENPADYVRQIRQNRFGDPTYCTPLQHP